MRALLLSLAIISCNADPEKKESTSEQPSANPSPALTGEPCHYKDYADESLTDAWSGDCTPEQVEAWNEVQAAARQCVANQPTPSPTPSPTPTPEPRTHTLVFEYFDPEWGDSATCSYGPKERSATFLVPASVFDYYREDDACDLSGGNSLLCTLAQPTHTMANCLGPGGNTVYDGPIDFGDLDQYRTFD